VRHTITQIDPALRAPDLPLVRLPALEHAT
jgi:hypothetical protein